MNVNYTQPYCIQECIFSFVQPEKDASGENKIALTTALLGMTILLSGIADAYRVCSSSFSEKNRKWSKCGNCLVMTVAFLKIAAGIAFIANGYLFEPFKWNTELLDKCNNTCSILAKHDFYTPSPTPESSYNPCCSMCDDKMSFHSYSDNYGISIGFGVPIMISGVLKFGYTSFRDGKVFFKKRCIPKTLIDMRNRVTRFANTSLPEGLIEIICTIAIFILIPANTLAQDKNIYDVSSSGSWDSSTSGGVYTRCGFFCNLFNPYWTRECW